MKPVPPPADASFDETRALMSALADGEAAALQRACRAWRDDDVAREAWHTYHLIGDVLRSDDLAQPAPRDEAFLTALRTRLASEPVPLVPGPAPNASAGAAPRRTGVGWLGGAAVAAGFVAVAGMLGLVRLSAPGGEPQATVAAASAPATGPERDDAAALRVAGPLIRDAQLDGYLRAHREAMGFGAAAVPGGAPRSFESITTRVSASAR